MAPTIEEFLARTQNVQWNEIADGPNQGDSRHEEPFFGFTASSRSFSFPNPMRASSLDELIARDKKPDTGPEKSAPAPYSRCMAALLMPSKGRAIGKLIGRKGAAIASLEKSIEGTIKISRCDFMYPGTEDRIICIFTRNLGKIVHAFAHAVQTILESKLESDKLNESKGNGLHSSRLSVRFLVPDALASAVIGRRGDRISAIQDAYHVTIKISARTPDADNGVPSGLRLVTLSTTCEEVDNLVEVGANLLILSQNVRDFEHSFVSTLYDIGYPSMAAAVGDEIFQKPQPERPSAPLQLMVDRLLLGVSNGEENVLEHSRQLAHFGDTPKKIALISSLDTEVPPAASSPTDPAAILHSISLPSAGPFGISHSSFSLRGFLDDNMTMLQSIEILVLIPTSRVGRIMGLSGQIIEKLSLVTNTTIRVSRDEWDGKRHAKVSGALKQVIAALICITCLIHDLPLPLDLERAESA